MEPVNIENLENILTRIWNGELEHNQSKYFCGTACCVAGWDIVLNSEEQPEDSSDRETWFLTSKNGAYHDPWLWSREHNNLTEAESRLMYSPHSTKYVHETVLKALKEGRRLDDTEFNLYSPSDSYSYEGSVEISDHSEDKEALLGFLGDFDKEKIVIDLMD